MQNEERVRDRRLDAIRKLLGEGVVARQVDIVEGLLAQGFEVTQGSVSRDLVALRVTKEGGHYVVGGDAHGFPGVLSVQPAGPNLVVVRTAIGAAQMVSYHIDEACLDGIVGTVAGDDTIFIATLTDSQAPVMAKLKAGKI